MIPMNYFCTSFVPVAILMDNLLKCPHLIIIIKKSDLLGKVEFAHGEVHCASPSARYHEISVVLHKVL